MIAQEAIADAPGDATRPAVALPRLSVDLSLAKGLRSAIVKKIEASRNATDKAANNIFRRKATMPTTKKGARALHGELAKQMDRFALASNERSSVERYGFWHRWALRRAVSVDSWEEDLLSVDGVIFDLVSPRQAWFDFEYPVALSMHLVERVYLRLNTKDAEEVIGELLIPTLTACSLGNTLFHEMKIRGIASLPIAIPTENGAIAGDAVIGENGKGAIHFRTFLGGKAPLGLAKKRLLRELTPWGGAFKLILGEGLRLSIVSPERIGDAIASRPGAQEFHGIVRDYLDILARHSRALDDRECRAERRQREYQIWTAPREG